MSIRDTPSQYGQFVMTHLPPQVTAGNSLRCLVEMRIAAVKGCKAENDLLLELVCIATTAVGGGAVMATEEVWTVAHVLAPYKENGAPKVFDKGTHSFIVNVEVPSDCFPSVQPSTAFTENTQAQFAISYLLRCTFPSRDTPFVLNQPITVVQAPLVPSLLTPLVMEDRSPLGISVSVRANRSQWHADRPATLFYSFKAPFKSDVPTVLIEILQKLNLPTVSFTTKGGVQPPEAARTIQSELVVATFALPPAYASTVSNFTIRLSPVPYLAPTMYLGPIDVDYEIRVVAVFAPSAPGANPIVEFMATMPLNILPPSQDLDIEMDFDDIDPKAPTDGSANQVPVIQVAPVLPNRFNIGSQPPPNQGTLPNNNLFNSPPPQSGRLPFNSPPQQPQSPQIHKFASQQFMFNNGPHSPSSNGSPLPSPHLNSHPGPPMHMGSMPLPHQQQQQGTNPIPPPRVHRGSVQVVPDSLEARLKKLDAGRDRVAPVEALPGYEMPASPPSHHLSSLVEQRGAMFGGVKRPSFDSNGMPGAFPAPPTGAPPQFQNSAPMPDDRIRIQQEELERLQSERARLLREAQELRDAEQDRHRAEAASVEKAKQAELAKVLEEQKRLEDEKRALEDAERRAAEEVLRQKKEKELRAAEEERERIEAQQRLKAQEEARKFEQARLVAEEQKRVEVERRKAEDERIEALKLKTAEAKRQLELGKEQLEQEEQLRKLELELEQLRLEKQIAAEKIATEKQLEETRRLAEIARVKRDAELQAEKIALQAELQFAKERQENEMLKLEIEKLKAQRSGGASATNAYAGYAMGNISSATSDKARAAAKQEEEDEPLTKRNNAAPTRQKTQAFYKAVGLVREQTKLQQQATGGDRSSSTSAAAAAAVASLPPPPPPKTAPPPRYSEGSNSSSRPSGASSSNGSSGSRDAQMQTAYNNALDSYRGRLLNHLTFSSTPLTGREQAVARNDELMTASQVIGGGSKGSSLLSALEAEMRIIESEILESYENQLYQSVRERILDAKQILQASYDAGLIHSVSELNNECKAAFESIKVDGDVTGKVMEKAKASFEETVRQPLLRLVSAKEQARATSSYRR
ncbi:hypothetical protein CcCBS67573_g02355 [Chytriomyces confervae]|uniref:Uncharacterized protein n=1 Tax=Chytriomyces confervae TaxID=246404 RepID=A0A507FJC6_9FUNG|nr:hypothetical protein CcCBS67573_g02355 [Chytriomyces confervae]